MYDIYRRLHVIIISLSDAIFYIINVTFGKNVQYVQAVRRLELEAIQSIRCNYPRKLYRLHLNPPGVQISLCPLLAHSGLLSEGSLMMTAR